ncbi:MAG: exodeoxyribonuclease VII large subunit [Bacilli bacterium]|nr:exodeoxyribonuclease VII large subunit [Bacilli bacterium]
MEQVNYITITQLSKYLKYKFDEDVHLRRVYLKGEISNFKAHTRGHYYFTLKDENSRISAVMFQSNVSKIKFLPQDGMKVMVTGRVTVYEATGGYQIYVEDMSEDGVGNLYMAFEQLKKKLEAEGLFDKAHKKKIPRMPKKIGIVTASTGAAIRDILTTIKRRYPIVETILFPALVQGEYAAEDIAKKIEIANGYDIDTLIVGRGGGSIEDLWPFNEEIVARAIYNSKVPVISAVGHEVDFTIADFVADLRAPTPTAAAELAVVDINTIRDYLNTAKIRSYNAINNKIASYKDRLISINDSYIMKKPSNIYEVKEQKLDMLIDRINSDINKIIEFNRVRLFKFSESYILNNPKMLYVMKEENLKNIINKLNKEIDIVYNYKKNYMDNIVSKLMVLNPLSTISRGYTITRSEGKVISSIRDIKKDSNINIELRDGIIDAIVEGISEK